MLIKSFAEVQPSGNLEKFVSELKRLTFDEKRGYVNYGSAYTLGSAARSLCSQGWRTEDIAVRKLDLATKNNDSHLAGEILLSDPVSKAIDDPDFVDRNYSRLAVAFQNALTRYKESDKEMYDKVFQLLLRFSKSAITGSSKNQPDMRKLDLATKNNDSYLADGILLSDPVSKAIDDPDFVDRNHFMLAVALQNALTRYKESDKEMYDKVFQLLLRFSKSAITRLSKDQQNTLLLDAITHGRYDEFHSLALAGAEISPELTGRLRKIAERDNVLYLKQWLAGANI